MNGSVAFRGWSVRVCVMQSEIGSLVSRICGYFDGLSIDALGRFCCRCLAFRKKFASSSTLSTDGKGEYIFHSSLLFHLLTRDFVARFADMPDLFVP